MPCEIKIKDLACPCSLKDLPTHSAGLVSGGKAIIFALKDPTQVKVLCRVINGIAVTSCMSSVVGLLFLSVNHYLAATTLMRYKSLVTVRRTLYALVGCWTHSAAVGFCIAMFASPDET